MVRTAAAWATAGLAAGLGLALALVAANPSARGAGALVATALLAATYVLLGAGVGLLVAALRGLAGRAHAPSFGSELGVAGLAVGLAALLGAALPNLGGGALGWLAWALPGLAGLAAALALPRPPGAAVALGVPALLGVGLVAALLVLGRDAELRGPDDVAAASPAAVAAPAPTRSPRVLWIGVDGADWRSVDRLVAQGRLPTLAGLIARGVRLPLRTYEPTWSPLIWNTLASGVRPERHGVLDFAETPLPGAPCGLLRLRKRPRLVPDTLYLDDLLTRAWLAGWLHQVPVTSCQRRRKAIWDVLSERGRRVVVVNWFATYPAEEVDGALVSDNNPWRAAFLGDKHDVDAETRTRITWPRGLMSRLHDLPLPDLPEAPEAIAKLPWFADADPAAKAQVLADDPALYGVFRHILMSDAFATEAARALMQREHPDFTAVYLSAVDNTSHRFGRMEGVVDRVWETTDARLARLLEAAGPDTTVLITSDHGWEYDEPFGHFHAPDGVFLLAGPGAAAPGAPSGHPSVYDVAPTLLALFGLPAADEMPGHVVREALAPGLRDAPAPPRIASYGRFRPPPPEAEAQDAPLRDETLKRLRALGYVD